MSLVTQCPQCALLFQVSRDQLAQGQGWVRCGRCEHLFEGEAFAIQAPVLDTPLHADAFDDAPRVDLEALLRRQDVPSEPEPVAPAVSALSPDDRVEPTITAAVTEWDRPGPDSFKTDLRVSAQPLTNASSGGGVHRFIAGVLAMGLAVQALFFFRDDLVARFPASRSVGVSMCQLLGCQLQPLRRASGIVIDQSSLVHGEEGYALNITLRNALDVTLGMTSLELTLTDEQDRPLVRRVLSPAQLSAPAELAAGQTWAQTLSLAPDPALAEIAGYRLVSFYP